MPRRFIGFRLDESEIRKLDNLAKEARRNRTDTLRQLIRSAEVKPVVFTAEVPG